MIYEPTPIQLMCRKVINLPLKNVDFYYPNEVFVELIFYNGQALPYYFISNYGRIYSVTFHKLMKCFIDQRGYSRLNIRYDRENKKDIFTGIHKLTLMSFNPIIESKLFIPHHIDNNPQNNYIGNLTWVTPQYNTIYAVQDQCMCMGEDNSRAILTNDQVRVICQYLENGIPTPDIATALGYLHDNQELRNKICCLINHIKRGQTYTFISSNYNIPGIKGRKSYPEFMTAIICEFLTDPYNLYNIEEICDLLDIPLADRKMFFNYVKDIKRRQIHKGIINKYGEFNNLIPLPKNHPYYNYYY